MRFSGSFTRRFVSLAVLSGVAAVWSGCDATKQTEYVAGVSTQVQVPRDLKAIRVDISTGGVVQFCRAYKVYDGKVQLPRSLGSFKQPTSNSIDPLTVTVTGFTEDLSDATTNAAFNDCVSTPAKVGANNARILRRSRQPYVTDQILFLPMPLKYACFDKDCDDDSGESTCKGGRCTGAAIDVTKLRPYADELVDGTGGACFHATECLAAGAPPLVVDPNDCTYALPNTPSAPPLADGVPPNPFPKSGDGVNVQVVYDGGAVAEILDEEPDEGFTIPDPAKPQQFRLAPGLCDMVKGFGPDGKDSLHRITAIRASGTCQAKSPMQPLCAGDQLAAMGLDSNGQTPSILPQACVAAHLEPAPSALLLLADDTENSRTFYTGAGQPVAASAALGLSLSDPAFEKTKAALSFFPGTPGCGAHTPEVALDLARTARDKIVGAFESRAKGSPVLQPLDSAVDLDAALRDAYALLGAPEFQAYYRRAVVVFGNRGFQTNACGGVTSPVAQATAAAGAASKIQTYVVMLANDHGTITEDPLVTGGALATAGGTPQVYDGRADKAQGQAAFSRIVRDIATCVYDVDTGAAPTNGDVLSYSDPVTSQTHTITFDAACNGDGVTANGWGIDSANPKRVRVCGQPCDDYRTILETAAAYAAQDLQPALAVPMFAHKANCAPSASIPFAAKP